ncbi:hypothetical protein [Paenibacillus tundrae]|uniref:Uncharacterized protein n=1 Tax=Paenibacillus tundrae TaxID=528187 RepID=A0ABT9W655_9BACL|nr:hypothetical protein [Paenibacillus tundrae]MDQ0168738.1 hypothetical protein [Paenibacillus tundrae]
MAQLTGVKERGEGFIEFNGEYYEAQHESVQAAAGDIVRHDTGYSFLPAGTYDILDHDLEFADEDGDYWSYDSDNDTLFRKVPPLSESLATKRDQLATLTAEIAQLEAQLAEESRLKVGDYARVTDISSVDNFNEGDIVIITRIDDQRHTYVLRGESVTSEGYEWFSPAALTKITPAEARASLIAKIDAHFGGQEAD